MENRKLDRVVKFDYKSKGFPIRELLSDGRLSNKTWKCKQYLDQGTEGACFLKGIFIKMSDNSQKKIEDIKLLDKVRTAEGNVGLVKQLMVKEYIGDLYEIKIRGHHEIKCTDEHPFLTQRGYVKANKLKVGDYIAITKGWVDENINNIDVSDIVDNIKFRGKKNGEVSAGGVISKTIEPPKILNTTYGLGKIFGLYAAEGWTTENKVVWSFGGHEEHTLVKELVDLLSKELNIEARLQYRTNKSINVNVYGKPWRILFSKLIKGTSKYGDKRLTSLLTNNNSEFLRGVLDGWLDGDGHKRRTSNEGITVSHQLALDMHNMGNTLGMLPTINVSEPSKNKYAKTRQLRWSVTFPLGNGNNLPKQTENIVWRKLMSVETEKYEGYVYNFHVEGDESYVAEGVGVHNCVGFSWAHELNAVPFKIRVMTDTARTIYFAAQQWDQWEGTEYEGTSVLAGAKVIHSLGHMPEYRWAFGIDDVLRTLSEHGPIVLGVNWYEGMFNTNVDGFIKPTGELAGGHAILANGVTFRKRSGFWWKKLPEPIIRLHNSWGTDWGVGGDAFITASDLAILLEQQGEACVPLKRTRN